MQHYWGDSWFEKYGNQINDAVNIIENYCHKYGRFGGQSKEKYGTVRFYCHFHYSLHDLIYPGYAYMQWPRWISRIDHFITQNRLYEPVRTLIHKWQYFIYRRAYYLAAKKWPDIKTEIYVMAEYPELLGKDFDFTKHWVQL